MIICLKKEFDKNNLDELKNTLIKKGFTFAHISDDIIRVLGDTTSLDVSFIMAHPCVLRVQRINYPFYLASKEYKQEQSIIKIGNVEIGNKSIALIAGPCAIESEEQIVDIALNVKKIGASVLRGGISKPRTSPYSFQGLQDAGIEAIKSAKHISNLPVVTEIVSIEQIKELYPVVDAFQVGTRNMQNFELLKALGKIDKPIILKRGFSNTIEEWLMAAEYILLQGNKNVILCERGIRTFENYTRFTLDLSSIPLIKQLSHLPIIVDPSHAAGRWDLVESMSLAAIAAGADGLLIEVHNNPQIALSDGYQSLKYDNFKSLVNKAKKVATAIGRKI